MTTLILQHFEPYWSEGLSKLNTSFEQEMVKVLDFVNNTDIDRVIITQFEEHEFSSEHTPLLNLCEQKGISIECITYGYGWHREEEGMYPVEEEGITWCQGTRDYHGDNDVIAIEDWHHEIKNNNENVLIAGSFWGECLSDIKAVIERLDINYEMVEGLCVGSYVPYDFKGISPDFLMNEIQESINFAESIFESYDLENIHDLYALDSDLAVKIEKSLNDSIYENLEILDSYNLKYNISSCNDGIQEIIDYIVEEDSAFEEISDLLDEMAKVNLIKKLSTEEKTVNKMKPF